MTQPAATRLPCICGYDEARDALAPTRATLARVRALVEQAISFLLAHSVNIDDADTETEIDALVAQLRAALARLTEHPS